MILKVYPFPITDVPRRLKPLNSYYHFYSGSKLASLEEIYDWCLTQETFPIHASDYCRRVDGFYRATLSRHLDGNWKVRGLNALRTVRLPPALGWPNLALTDDVTCVRDLPQGRYVSVLGKDTVTIPLTLIAPTVPYLRSSNARIVEFERQELGFRAVLDGFLDPIEIEIGGLGPSTSGCRIQWRGKEVPWDGQSVLKLEGKKRGEVSLICPRS
jgi:hypothetical protein